MKKRTDSWQNLITGLGTMSDKRTANKTRFDIHSPQFYEELYASGGIPARIVDLIPEEALRHWIEFLDVEKDEAEDMHDQCEMLDVRGAIGKTWKWGRAYGGACCHVVTDTTDPASPLRMGEKILGLRDLSRWDLRILTTDVEYDFGSPNWGHPRIYYLNVQMGSQYKGYPIHWTRMIRFDGQLVPRRTYILNNYWHDSILNRLYNSIRNYESANDSAAAVLQDFNVDVYKMKNLANLIQSGKEQIVKNRVEMLNFTKSVINAMIIDTDSEDYENRSRSVEGMAELLVHQANRLVAETDIPHTKLLGESPDGSNATGNSTSQQWYNYIASEQENYLRPKLKRLFSIIFGREVPFKFKSLRVLDDAEKADLRLKIAQADQIYLDHNVVDPTEVADSRFGGDEYSTEMEIDWEAREAGLVVPGQIEGGPGNISGEWPGDSPNVERILPNKNPGAGSPNSGGPGFGNSSPSGNPGQPGSTANNQRKAIPSAKANGVETGSSGEPKPFSTTGNRPPEGKSRIVAKPSEPEPGNDFRGAEGEKKDLTGIPPKQQPTAEGQGIGELFSGAQKPGTEFDMRNEELKVPNAVPKTASFISQTMSEPMRDPRTDPHLKGPGIPNKQRTFLPTRGSGLMAPSGYDFEKDPKLEGAPRESLQVEPAEENQKYKYDGALKDKEIDQKPGRAATIIVRRGDHFLMGPTNENGKWTLPGGVVEDSESLHQGAIRELGEETGLKAERLKFLGSRLVENEKGRPVTVSMYEHRATDSDKPTGRHDPDKEVSKWKWVHSKDELPEEISGNLKHPNNIALAHLGLLK